MRLPNPTTSEVRWSFAVVFLCAVALTATISWGVVHKVNQSDQIVRIAASSADQVERLNAQLDAQGAQLAAQAAASEAQRAELQRQNRLTRAQLRALLRYLRAHGIEVPQTALTPPARADQGSVTRPKADGPQGPKPAPSPSPSHPASPATTAPPSPTASPAPTGSPLCDLLTERICPLP